MLERFFGGNSTENIDNGFSETSPSEDEITLFVDDGEQHGITAEGILEEAVTIAVSKEASAGEMVVVPLGRIALSFDPVIDFPTTPGFDDVFYIGITESETGPAAVFQVCGNNCAHSHHSL